MSELSATRNHNPANSYLPQNGVFGSEKSTSGKLSSLPVTRNPRLILIAARIPIFLMRQFGRVARVVESQSGQTTTKRLNYLLLFLALTIFFCVFGPENACQVPKCSNPLLTSDIRVAF